MKKVKKVLLSLGLMLTTVGTVGLTNKIPEKLLESNIFGSVQAYNHNPNNILDNVFENNGLTVLPFVFENSDETIKKSYVVEQFKNAGITIENQSSISEIITTGTQIRTNSKTYTVLIYGDVNGDGYVDVFDAQNILRHYVYGENYSLTGIYEIAANVNNEDNEVDVFDSQRILRFYVGFETKLVINEPTSLKEIDNEAPVITLKGSNPQTIKVGETYTELGIGRAHV